MKKIILSSAISASVTIVVTTSVTIWAELTPGFKNFLAGVTGHHWVTKSLVVIILFPAILGLVYGLIRGKVTDEAIRKSLWILAGVVVLGFAAILGFYIWHYFQI